MYVGTLVSRQYPATVAAVTIALSVPRTVSFFGPRRKDKYTRERLLRTATAIIQHLTTTYSLLSIFNQWLESFGFLSREDIW
jgi:hypothetical protein